ncbi:hypothetical protein P9112_004193 [Eukaryota sp. TZLM1-RC]
MSSTPGSLQVMSKNTSLKKCSARKVTFAKCNGQVKRSPLSMCLQSKNTAAYKDFIKTSKARRHTKSAPPKKRHNSISSPPVTRASRARRSKERKRQC